MKQKEILNNFGRRVRVLRMAQKLSQEALAHKASLDRTYIGGIERGERNIGVLNIVQVATALGVHPSDLFIEWANDD